jgi:D-alanyl-lipoteichoic acid acyltransferase DltB (MBOAT superfamily)
LGIELPYNFREPLTRARSLQDYWRRHNITLFAWFRDYVYRPLRPRATTVRRASLLVVLVFTLSGLWHGATAGWILWGLFMGTAVVVETQIARAHDRRARQAGRAAGHRDRRVPLEVGDDNETTATIVATRRERSIGSRLRSMAYILPILGLSVVLIRAPSVAAALQYYREILSFRWVPLDWNNVLLVAYAAIAIILSDAREHALELTEDSADPPSVPRALLWGVMICLIIVFSGTPAQPFVYFQF